MASGGGEQANAACFSALVEQANAACFAALVDARMRL